MRFVNTDVRGDVVVVTMQRPPANALNPELLADGLAVLDVLLRDQPRAVVVTGTGAFFSGGADLREVPELSQAQQAEMARGINRLFDGFQHFPRPVVTAVNGHAVAGGLILALCGDYRVGPRSGRFGLTEVRVGIPYPSAAMAVVQAELAPPVARRLVLRGELFDASAAEQLGIFDELVDDARVLDRSLDVAEQMAALPPTTYEIVKRQFLAGKPSRPPRSFGGAEAVGWVTAEAPEAASTVLRAPKDAAGDG